MFLYLIGENERNCNPHHFAGQQNRSISAIYARHEEIKTHQSQSSMSIQSSKE